MIEGTRISSYGHRNGVSGEGIHKSAAVVLPTGPREVELLRRLSTDETVGRNLASHILAGEISLSKFLDRHDAALAIWNDSENIGVLAKVPARYLTGALARPTNERKRNMNTILMEILNRANHLIELDKAGLEVEENGRKVALLQGKLIGYRNLIDLILGNFENDYLRYELHHKIAPRTIPDLDDGELRTLSIEAEQLQESNSWKELKIQEADQIEEMKSYLLFSAEKVRDLDLYQGRYNAMTSYVYLFMDIEHEVNRREEKAQKEREQPGLF